MQLRAAAKQDDVAKMEQCLGAGVNVDDQDEYGTTALVVAAFYGRSAAAKLLITHKADVNHICDSGHFPLYAAVCCGEGVTAVTDILLKAGADFTMTFQGQTAQERAAENGVNDVSEMITYWAEQHDIVNAAKRGDVKKIEQFLDLGSDVDHVDKFGCSALVAASLYGHHAAVEFLLARKADVNLKSKPSHFPLYCAASLGHKLVCEALLKGGADKMQAINGSTSALRAAEHGFPDVAGLILSWGESEGKAAALPV